MSTFVIFAIVLTLDYILYYAAMITIDLTAKPKTEDAAEETIATDGMNDADDDFVPRSVVENAETGGFSFSSPEPADVVDSDIEEAVDEESIAEEPQEHAPAETDWNSQEETSAPSAPEAADTPTDTPEQFAEPAEDKGADTDSTETEASIGDEPSITDGEQDVQQEEEEPIPGMEYYVEKPEEKKDDDFDVSDAFDPDLMTPKFGVTQVVEPPVSEEAQEKAATVNASLWSIASKGNQMDSFNLSRVIREHRAEQHNIETHDEVTNY